MNTVKYQNTNSAIDRVQRQEKIIKILNKNGWPASLVSRLLGDVAASDIKMFSKMLWGIKKWGHNQAIGKKLSRPPWEMTPEIFRAYQKAKKRVQDGEIFAEELDQALNNVGEHYKYEPLMNIIRQEVEYDCLLGVEALILWEMVNVENKV